MSEGLAEPTQNCVHWLQLQLGKTWVSVMKSLVFLIFVFLGSLATVGLCLLFVEVSKSHSDTAHSVGLL